MGIAPLLFQNTPARLITLDYLVIGLYFLAVFAIGYYHSRKERTAAGYFLASRDVAWWAIGASLFSSNIGSEHFIGLAGTGAASGLAVGHFEWLASIILLILGWVFVPFYLRSNVYTMPEFLERRYNRACRTYLASISLIAYIFTKIAVGIFAGAIVLEKVLGWTMWQSAFALIIATGIYTVAGGLAAVIYTEVIQTVILVLGAFVLMFIGLSEVGGWSGLRAAVPPDFFHMMKPADHADFPWTGIFFGAPLLGIWYWCTDQVIVQRVLSAKDISHAKRGTVLAGFLKILPVFMLVVPGMIARAKFPAQMEANSNSAFPTLVVELLPSGLLGVMVAAMLAALMSSLSAVFNSSSTIFTMDFYKRWRPEATDAHLVTVGRFATVIMVALGLAWIPFMSRISDELVCLSAERAGIHLAADCGGLSARRLLETHKRSGSDLGAARGLSSRRKPLHSGSGLSEGRGARRARGLFRQHELPPLRDIDVRRVRGRAGRRQPCHARARKAKGLGLNLPDRKREDRFDRGGI